MFAASGSVGGQKLVTSAISLTRLTALFAALNHKPDLWVLGIYVAAFDTVLALVVLVLCRQRFARWSIDTLSQDRVERVKAHNPEPLDRVSIARSASGFVVVQLQANVLANSDALVVGVCVGPSAVPLYMGLYRTMQLGALGLQALQSPVLPRLARLHGVGEVRSMEKAFGAFRLLIVSIGVAWVLVAVSWTPRVLQYWLGVELSHREWLLPAAMATYQVIAMVGSTNSVWLNAVGRTREQALSGLAEGVLKLGIAVPLSSHFGVLAVAIASSVAAATAGLWLIPAAIAKHSKNGVQLRMLSYVLVIVLTAMLSVAICATQRSTLHALLGTLVALAAGAGIYRLLPAYWSRSYQ
jgi:O-antigen/teichoic acid export membrane protein